MAFTAAEQTSRHLLGRGDHFLSEDVEVLLVRRQAQHDQIGVQAVQNVSSCEETTKWLLCMSLQQVWQRAWRIYPSKKV